MSLRVTWLTSLPVIWLTSLPVTRLTSLPVTWLPIAPPHSTTQMWLELYPYTTHYNALTRFVSKFLNILDHTWKTQGLVLWPDSLCMYEPMAVNIYNTNHKVLDSRSDESHITPTTPFLLLCRDIHLNVISKKIPLLITSEWGASSSLLQTQCTCLT
jgi:hypothetical protein